MDEDELVLAVEKLVVIHDRYDSEHSDASSTSTGDGGENRDVLNHPET